MLTHAGLVVEHLLDDCATCGQLGFASPSLGQNLATLVVSELAPSADLFRRAQTSDAHIRFAIEFADIETW